VALLRPVAVLLQRYQGEGVGFYLTMPSRHLLRPAKVAESLVCDQEH
jgi:hypothetical protein